MVLERILQYLQQSTLDRHEAGPVCRLGLLEWISSLPAGCDIGAEAAIARIRIARCDLSTPALMVFHELLRQAALPLPVPERRGGARARRTLH
ncbi:MAG: hypothetical protein RIC16_08875 [Rhodospirillales bacterium]